VKLKKTILTISHQNKGHGTFPRHERMALTLQKKGFDVIWISPKGNKNKNFINLDLAMNFIPNFLFLGIYFKVLITCVLNLRKIIQVDYLLAVREYDAISLFYNPFFFKSKKIFFSRGDVISILKINLPDKNFLEKLKDNLVIFIYPYLQKIIHKKLDLIIFQAKFLRNLYFKRIKIDNFKTKILPNECNSLKYLHAKKNSKKLVTIGFAAPMYWSCKGLNNIVNIINYQNKIKNIEYKFRIAGDGPHLSKLKENLNNHSKNKIKFLGWKKNIYNFLSSIDLLIVTSNFDSNPNMILEALSCNKIILATNIKAHKAILNYKELMFKKNQIKFLYDKIYKINNNQIYKKKIKKIIQITKERNSFNWENHFYKIIKEC
jgi:glycosyltransferase involved in cell wall biosynthesis